MWQLPGDQLSELFWLVLQKMTSNGSKKSRRCCTWMTSLFCFDYLLLFFFPILHSCARSVLFIPARDARRRVPENQKDIVALYASFNSLRNAFPVLSFPFFFCIFSIFFFLHFCTGAHMQLTEAPQAACARHVLRVCVLLPSVPSPRWTGPAVWNSADPLK